MPNMIKLWTLLTMPFYACKRVADTGFEVSADDA
jgi:hypothetical protein